MIRIYVKPDKVWDLFQNNKEHFEVAWKIAEILDDETKETLIAVCLIEENDYPLITIEQEEKILIRECAISSKDCTMVYEKLLEMLNEYDEELKLKMNSETSAEVDEIDLEIIADRESESREALAVFLNVLCGDDENFYDEELLGEILDNIEQMMYQEFDYIFYRPQIIECDGKFKVVESFYEDE